MAPQSFQIRSRPRLGASRRLLMLRVALLRLFWRLLVLWRLSWGSLGGFLAAWGWLLGGSRRLGTHRNPRDLSRGKAENYLTSKVLISTSLFIY